MLAMGQRITDKFYIKVSECIYLKFLIFVYIKEIYLNTYFIDSYYSRRQSLFPQKRLTHRAHLSEESHAQTNAPRESGRERTPFKITQ